jgi:hypothetical protein
MDIHKTIHLGVDVVPRALTDSEGKEFFEFEISNETRDSHGTIFRMAGVDINDFNSDPIVTYGHPSFDSTDPDDVIGIGPVTIEQGRMMARFYPQTDGTNPKAEKVVAKLKGGMIRSASIVAQIHDGHMGQRSRGEDENTLYFDKWQLLAWGVVMKGSNPKAKARTIERVIELRNQLTDTKTIQEAKLMETRLTALSMKSRLAALS